MSPRASIGASRMDGWKEFDRIFLDAAEEGLMQVLGETASEMTFLHLERYRGLKKAEIPRKIEEFSSALTELLGTGTCLLENLFIKRLYSKLEVEYEKSELRFADQVEGLRRKFEG